MLEHLGGSSLLESARAQGRLESSMLEQRSRLGSSRLVSNTTDYPVAIPIGNIYSLVL